MVLACNNSKLARKQSEATKMTRVEGKRVFILGSECVAGRNLKSEIGTLVVFFYAEES